MISRFQRLWRAKELSPVRNYSSSSASRKALSIGYVPEHFSTPLYFAHKYFDLDASLVPYLSGTGHMIQSLKSSEIDIGIGLTEGWVAGLGKHAATADFPYRIVGTYVDTPLCWAISTGVGRDNIRDTRSLRGKRIGVSRIGSGSYVMGYVLADKQGWLQGSADPKPFEVVPLNDFKGLRDGVNSGRADFFMWEHFTSKRYYDSAEIKRVGEIYTPWSSWMIVARDPADDRLEDVLTKINRGIEYFGRNQEQAVRYISTKLDYSEEDARAWLNTVKFANDVRGVDSTVVTNTIDVLRNAGVLDTSTATAANMIAQSRATRPVAGTSKQ